ncbi:MAG: thioredoxin family protein [Planctomycetes bacterium]|nr:thioredoxin family protein [Planctomycetota bacterium]
MNFLQRLLFSGVVLAAPSLALAGDKDVWIADYDKAVEAAKAQKKDLFVDFTGSDWCGWCKRLDAEVFSKAEFLDAIQKDYVLVALDYPQAEAVKKRVPNPARNEELKNKHAIQGYPTILLMTADGEVYGQTGYEPGGPVKYVESLNTLRATGRKALVDTKEIVAKFTAATGDEKNKLLDQAIATLGALKPGSPMAAQLGPVARTAFTSDADNKQGRKLRALKALLNSGSYDAELDKTGRMLDPKNEQGIIEGLVVAKLGTLSSEADVKDAVAAITEVDKLGIKDVEIKNQLYYTAANFCFQYLDDKEGAKAWATKLKASAGDKPELMEFYKAILG